MQVPQMQAGPQPTPAGPSTNLAPQAGSNGNVPANTIPALPNNTVQANPNTSNFPPSSANNGQYNNGQYNNGRYNNTQPNNNQFQGSSARTDVTPEQSAPFQPRVQNPDIRPLPDLDRAPPLLNPNDRSASRVAPGTIVPISWQTSAPEQEAYSAPANHSAPANDARMNNAQPARPKTRRLDDSGWVPAGTF